MSDIDTRVTTHGVTGSLAWVIFFPLGAILMRLVNGPMAIWIHAATQLIGLMLFTINFGLGVWIVQISEGTFKLNDYHPAIGIVLFSFAWLQPIGGLAHHSMYKKKGGRTIISYIHIWLGRILITLGMIQGGLGLLFAGDATRGELIAYGVIAGLIWVAYVAIVVFDITKGGSPPEEKR